MYVFFYLHIISERVQEQRQHVIFVTQYFAAIKPSKGRLVKKDVNNGIPQQKYDKQKYEFSFT
jgi:hypothetical protein